MNPNDLDFDARYSVKSMPGIAFYLNRWPQKDVMYVTEELDYETLEIFEIEVPSGEMQDDIGQFIYAVMVGDDREHLVDIDDLEKLDEPICDCGQIGCGFNV